MNVYDRFPNESMRSLLMEVPNENDPQLTRALHEQSTLTREQVDRIDTACCREMRFVGDGEDIPTERSIRLENIIDVLYETRPKERSQARGTQLIVDEEHRIPQEETRTQARRHAPRHPRPERTRRPRLPDPLVPQRSRGHRGPGSGFLTLS